LFKVLQFVACSQGKLRSKRPESQELHRHICMPCHQGCQNVGALQGITPLPFEKGATGAQMPLHSSIISNFMNYQDQVETNLLQLFAHT